MPPTSKIDLKKLDQAFNFHVRPQSFPLAVRLCTADEKLPPKTYFPKEEMGKRIVACQSWAMARRYGWTVAIGREDQACPHGQVVLGFAPKEGYVDGTLAEKAGLGTKEQFAKTAANLSFLEYGRYHRLLVSPIGRADFDPHFILFYGNPAQVARLVQGATMLSGSVLNSTAGPGIACSSLIAKTMITDQCQVVLAGAGDRYFALTQDHELAFTIPVSQIESLIEGLEVGGKQMGHRWPTPSFIRFEAPVPRAYQELTKLLTGDD